MSQTDTSARPGSGVETARVAAGSGREYASKIPPYLRRGVESGAVTAMVGGAGLLGGLRALRGGERKRGLAGLVFGAASLAAAVAQRRYRSRGGESGVEVADVVDAGTDVETIADEAGGIGEEDHSPGEAAASVADTSPDVEDVEPGFEFESGTDAGVDSEDLAEATGLETGDAGDATETATGAQEIDRLGEAAFDGQSQEVPAPQRAFNQGVLAHSTEAFWGVRTRDDAVLVSQNYDAVEGRDGVRYVASSAIGDDVRELPIPSAVLDHWDEVLGGGTAVAGGDDVLFVTTDELATDGLLRVLPAEWADDVFGEGE